jgi:hypothetical protein
MVEGAETIRVNERRREGRRKMLALIKVILIVQSIKYVKKGSELVCS